MTKPFSEGSFHKYHVLPFHACADMKKGESLISGIPLCVSLPKVQYCSLNEMFLPTLALPRSGQKGFLSAISAPPKSFFLCLRHLRLAPHNLSRGNATKLRTFVTKLLLRHATVPPAGVWKRENSGHTHTMKNTREKTCQKRAKMFYEIFSNPYSLILFSKVLRSMPSSSAVRVRLPSQRWRASRITSF